MACARSESIFCWPRTFADFFLRREELFDDAECVLEEDEDFVAEVEEVVLYFGVVFEVVGLALLSVEVWVAPAAEAKAQLSRSAQIALTSLLRFSHRTDNLESTSPLSPHFRSSDVQFENKKSNKAGTTLFRSLHHLRSLSVVPALLGGFALRKCASQEDGAVLTGRSALPDQEHHVLPALQA